jgi:hypothetical protein
MLVGTIKSLMVKINRQKYKEEIVKATFEESKKDEFSKTEKLDPLCGW